MKSVHKTLDLRHHKHTGKILPHKHTSYRVLFLLMLAPIFMMALVGQLSMASDLMVSAVVPAPMPSDAPAITSPSNGATTDSAEIDVSGTCPVIIPAVIIAVYDGTALIGSGECTATGDFSIPVSLSFGTHVLVATVVTITGQTGASSPPVTITRPPAAGETPNAGAVPVLIDGLLPVGSIDALAQPFHIMTSDIYLLMDLSGKVVWHGHFEGGTAPYTVQIDWGDGSVDTHDVADQTDQTFSHTYTRKQSYEITITATDASGAVTTLSTLANTLSMQGGVVGIDNNNTLNLQQPASIFGFIEQYAVQIYISTLSGLSFLWYMENGRHLSGVMKIVGKGIGSLHWHR